MRLDQRKFFATPLGEVVTDLLRPAFPELFRIDFTGLWKVEFLLFKDGDFSSAYRELHLYIRVT